MSWAHRTFEDETTLINRVDELLDEDYITITGKGKGEVFIDVEMEAINFPCVLFIDKQSKQFFVLDRFGFADIKVLGFRFPIPEALQDLIMKAEGFGNFLELIESGEGF